MNKHVFQDSSKAGVYHVPGKLMEAAVAAAGAAGLQALSSDVGQFATRADVLKQFGRSWNFPDWYGVNLDALYDCLTDPDWHPARPCVLVVSGLAKLRAAHPEDFVALIDVLRAAAESCRENGTPLWILVDSATADTPALPGA